MSVEDIGEKLGVRKVVNPLSGAAEFYLQTSDKAWVRLSVHPDGKTRLEAKSRGMRHTIESEASQVRVIEDGVEVEFKGAGFDTTAHISPTQVVNVFVKPK